MMIPDLSKESILYLEDEVLIALDVEHNLKNLGFGEVVTVHNLWDAKAAAAERTFNIALLDINLGNGQTSIAFANGLINAGTSVIFASGYNSSEKMVDHLQAQFIEKPFTEQSLRMALAQVFVTTAA